MGDLHLLIDSNFEGEDRIVSVYFKKFYNKVKEFMNRHEVKIDMKYKIVAKKVKPMALPIPSDYEERVENAST